ncbi:MAG: hypothetical protein ACE5EU_12675 [Paracoccaceae bacterium]
MENRDTRQAKPGKGVVTKLFGVILIFLGVLDSMMSWRGGFVVDEIYTLMIVAGLSLYVVGVIRSGTGR